MEDETRQGINTIIAEIKAGNEVRALERQRLEAATQPELSHAAINRLAIESASNSAS